MNENEVGRRVGHAEEREASRVFVGKPEGKRSLGGSRHR
jgi:hypothetical protein